MGTVKHVFVPEEAQFSSSTFPQFLKTIGTNFPVSGLGFDATSDENAFWKFLASNYAAAASLTVNIYWYADTATSGSVYWDAAIAAITPDEAQNVETKAFATINSANEATSGTAQAVNKTTITITNLDSMAADDICWLKLTRDANHASDNMAGDAIVILVELTYSDV